MSDKKNSEVGGQDLTDDKDTKSSDGTALEKSIATEGKILAPASADLDTASPATQPVARYFSFVFLLGVIGLVGMIFYWVMARFLIPLFLAALLVVIFRPLHRWMLLQTRGRQKWAALLTTTSILLTVLVPIALLIVMAAAEGRDVLKQFNTAKILTDIQGARTRLNLDLPNANQLRNIENRFLKLQTVAVADRNDLESQSSDLYEILGASQQVAADQGFVEVVVDADENAIEGDEQQPPMPQADRLWNQYFGTLKKTKALQAELLESQAGERSSDSERKSDRDANDQDKPTESIAGDASGGVSESIDQYNSKLHDYRVLIDQTSQQFDAFRYELLGGRTRAFAVEILNPTDEKLQRYASLGGGFLKDQIVRFGGFAGSVVGSLLLGSAIMIISLYFFLLDGPAMLESFKGLSPLDDEHEIALVNEFANVSRAVVVATLLSALAQGVLAGVGFYFAGLDSIFLLTLLSAVLAMVPFVGAAAVWVPCALYLYFFNNDMTSAIGLTIYGFAVISMADNFIKPYVLHGTSNLHPLLALLSVLGGVTALGPIGILIGPMVVVFLQTLLKILQRELTIMDGGEEASVQMSQ
jgi:predicted PurR-regulated permease PerM